MEEAKAREAEYLQRGEQAKLKRDQEQLELMQKWQQKAAAERQKILEDEH